MKFRAKSKDISSIQTFSQLLAALSHCSRKFVLRITPEKLCFILSDKEVSTATTSLLAWAEVPKDSTFLEYAMQGVSLEYNEIFLEISPEKIAGCLSSLKSSQSVEALKIKLTKRVVPCLSFEIEFPGANLNGNATCVHDIPVDPIKRKFWHHYTELQIPAVFDITIQMPDLKLVRLALERMKNLGPRLLIKASSAGKLTLSVETSTVKCIVKFQELPLLDHSAATGFQESERQPGEEQELTEFSVEVDLKTITQSISSDLHKPSKFFCSLIHCQRFYLYFQYGEITLQFVLPSWGDYPC